MPQPTDQKPFKDAATVFDTLQTTQGEQQTQELVRKSPASLTKKKTTAGGLTSILSNSAVSSTLMVAGLVVAAVGSLAMISGALANKQALITEAYASGNELLPIIEDLKTYYDQNQRYPDQIDSQLKAAAVKSGTLVSDFCYSVDTSRDSQNYILGARADDGSWDGRASSMADNGVQFEHKADDPSCFADAQ
jgi:hypothetical protein